MRIIGAGLSGLLAGALYPGSVIFESQIKLPNNHGALLRFRDDKISKALNIPFKKVRVTKNVFFDETLWDHPDIAMENEYSFKVTGQYSSRSIGNCDPVTRYIAPDDFIQQLAARCDIRFGVKVDDRHLKDNANPVISTIPMEIMMGLMGMSVPPFIKFRSAPIYTKKYLLKDVELYQTIYFPQIDYPLYRASITGDCLILEFTAIPADYENPDQVLSCFGIKTEYQTIQSSASQKYGKIVEIDNDVRRGIMAELTHEHNIYSLGRYATWRNILLDDVFDDIFKIQDIVRLDSYSRRLAL